MQRLIQSTTLETVAREAGVHPSTVSRVLNPATRDMVRDAVARRVEEVAARLGYRRNAVAASLRRGQSLTIGVVLPDITNPVFPPILSGIEAVLEPEGYVAMVANAGDDPARQAVIVERLAARQVDGLILATAARNDPVLSAVGGIPVVLVNRADDGGSVPAVVSDQGWGMALAVGHLVGLGHRRIGHVGGPPHLSTGDGRVRGFRAAMLEAGLSAAGVEHAGAYTRSAGRAACLALLGGPLVGGAPGLTGVVAANDLLALGCLDALREMGLACPGDVSVTGHNDMPLVDMVAPPLTTVRIPHWEMGCEAGRLLLQSMQGEHGRGERGGALTLVLRPTLVVRGSSGVCRAG